MIPNVNLDLVNQEHLKAQIDALEGGYVETIINLIKWPEFIKACKADIAVEGISDERKTAIEKTLAQHETNQKTNEGAIEQLNTIITEARKYLKND